MAPLPGYQRASRFLSILDKDIEAHLTKNLNKNVLVNIADYILPAKQPEFLKDIPSEAPFFTDGWAIDPDSCWRTPLKRANDHFSDKLYRHSCRFHTYSSKTRANKTLQCQHAIFEILRPYRIQHYNETVICNMLLFKHLWFNAPRNSAWRNKALKALNIPPSKDHAADLHKAIYSDYLATALDAALIELFAFNTFVKSARGDSRYTAVVDILNFIKLDVKKPRLDQKLSVWRRACRA